MEEVSQISRDHGGDVESSAPTSARVPIIPPLVDGLTIEQQLRQARRVVCVPGRADPVCAQLVDMSVRLGVDPKTETDIRAQYSALQVSLGDREALTEPEADDGS